MVNTENLPKQFGDNVRKERTNKGMSQEKLALNSGLDRTYISGIERGKRNPSLKNIGRIALALKLPISKLVD